MKLLAVFAAIVLVPLCAFADGVVLINQATLTAAGGTYRITKPGSYKLSGNLQARDQNTDVIVIASNNVSIDLNGFAILGLPNCSIFPCRNTGTGRGIATSSAVPNRDFFNITIRNGVIQGMGDAGIHLYGDSVLIEYIQSRKNGGSGIDVFSQVGQQFSVMIQRNNLTLNGWHGIALFGGGAVTDNICSGNALSGVIFAFGNPSAYGTVARNVLTNNGNFGFYLNAGSVNLIGNVLVGNKAGPNFGGVNQGQNLCNNGACPGAVF